MMTAESTPPVSSITTIHSYQLNWIQTESSLSVQIHHDGRLKSWLRLAGWTCVLACITTISWLKLDRYQLDSSRYHHFFTLKNKSQLSVGMTRPSLTPESDITVPPILLPSTLLVQPEDYVYLRNDWDAAPIVIEKYKLIFFTVPKAGCTVWKLLFRRIMGYADWQTVDWNTMLPHHPERNGLKYLYDYSMEEASAMLTSSQYTKAIFVRDPKERLLSAYLDKALRNNGDYVRARCCYLYGKCVPHAQESLEGFLNLTASCDDIHWRPQGKRMESKYWPYLNFVGHLETAQADAKRLLQSLRDVDGKTTAWNLYGSSGWGTFGNQSMFESCDGREHDTNADSQVKAYYTSLSFEQRVEQFYQSDYTNPKLNITLVRINH
jgi:hypothetical protein